METDSAHFGQWIKQRRAELDITQRDLANKVGCSVITIQKLEAGRRRPSHQIVARLAQALQIPVDERSTFARLARAQQREPATPQPQQPVQGLSRSRIPQPLTPLIGRSDELAILSDWVSSVARRLVTLVGPAGVGKTRLAMEVALHLQQVCREDVLFVSLATVHTPHLLFTTIAQAIDLQVDGPGAFACLSRVLHSRRCLLVLDNFEQIVAAAPALIDLLQDCPELRILVTSRERLHIRGEHVFSLPPLALPDASAVADSTDLSAVPAVALFCAVACAADPCFVLTGENATYVAQLCTRLDGLPLAIELFATRVATLSLSTLLAQLDTRLALAIQGPRDLPNRQRTLRATFDWSYALLTPEEQRLFTHVSVFEPGWSATAAVAIADLPQATDVLKGLDSLLAKCLIQRQGEIESRFVLLETVREYALEQLTAAGELLKVHQRHAEYYIALAETAAPGLKSATQDYWIEQLRHEHDNLRAALRWLVAQEQHEAAARLAIALYRFWWIQGYLSEGREWLTHVLDWQAMLTPQLCASAWYGYGTLAMVQGDHAQAEQSFRQGLALARRTSDPEMIGLCLHGLGLVLIDLQQYDEAQQCLAEGLLIDIERGDERGRAISLSSLGNLCYHRGDYLRTRDLYETVLHIQRQMGDLHSVALTLSNLSEIARRLGDVVAAQRYIDEGLVLLRRLDARRMLSYALNNLGFLCCELGDPTSAHAAFAEALELLRQTGEPSEIGTCLLGCAQLASTRRDMEHAARLLGALTQLHAGGAVLLSHTILADLNQLMLRVQAELPAERFTVCWDTGQQWSLEITLACAL